MPLEESRKRDPTDGRLTRHLLAGENSRAVPRLARGVIEAAVPTRLVTSFRRAATLDPCREPTSPAAVPVPAVTRLADRERRPAPPARQQVQHDYRQQPLAQTSSDSIGQAHPDGGMLSRHTRLSHPRPVAAATAPGHLASGRDDTQFLGRNVDAASPRMMTSRSVRRPTRQISALLDRRPQCLGDL